MNFLANLTRLAEMGGMAEYSGDPDFNAILPGIVDDAEQRAYRDLDLLQTRVTDTSGALAAAARSFTLPANKGIFVVLEQVSIVYPRVGGLPQPPLLPVSKECLEAMWPSDQPLAVPSVPAMWCPVDQKSILLAPAPDAAYPVVCFGTQRPLPLYTGATLNQAGTAWTVAPGSFADTGTILSLYLPDLFLAAECVFLSAWQREFGPAAQTSQATDYEGHYQALLKSATVEEMRKRFSSVGWSARQPSPIVSPPQT